MSSLYEADAVDAMREDMREADSRMVLVLWAVIAVAALGAAALLMGYVR